MKLRGQRAVATIETADVLLKVIRQSAVKAIHATAPDVTCKKSDDEDASDNDKDNEDTTVVVVTPTTTTSLAGDRKKDDEDSDSDHAKTKPAPPTFTGTASSIADQAIAAMQVAFNIVQNAPASTPKPTHSPEPTRSPKATTAHGTDTYGPKIEHHD
jgi:hypothetical protein